MENNNNPNQQHWNQQQFPGYGGGVQQDLPNATAILVCGIISIVFCLGLIGIILSIITLSMASSAKAQYNADPGRYTAASFSRVNAGRICSIVSLCLFGFILLILLLIIVAGNM